jgi:hypothetical protein
LLTIPRPSPPWGEGGPLLAFSSARQPTGPGEGVPAKLLVVDDNAGQDTSLHGAQVIVPIEDEKMPAEIDFSKGVRGLHHIPADARVFLPASIERSVWEYFSIKAEQKGIDLAELLTDALKRDIEINERLK